MSESQTVAARVRYLESTMEQLSEQNKTTKILVTTEVDDVRNAMAEQIAEIKQIIMYREKLYQERIRRLEARVEQLSEFALQIARTTSQTNALDSIPGSLVATAPPIEAPKAAEAIDDDGEDSVEGILKKYGGKIDAIYDYYTATSTQVASPCMTLTHFSKFLKDCHLSGFEQAEPAELLWMAVIRKLHTRKRRDPSAVIGQKRGMIISQQGRTKANQENFAYERLDEISRSEFPTALLHLAMEKVGRWQPDAPQEATLEAFLLRDIFPHTDRALERSRMTPGVMPGGADGSVARISIDEYRNDNVKQLIKNNIGSLKKTFFESIRTAQSLKDGELMSIEGFVELIRRHDLMSSISKTDLRTIFITCAQMEKAANPSAFENARAESVTVASLPRIVYHLADRIYGDPLFVSQFPTPEARVEKLLSKMFLLFDNRAR